MKVAAVIVIIFGIPIAVFLFFLGAELTSRIRKERRNAAWRKARKNAKWQVVTNASGQKVAVGIGRVARVKNQEELFDTSVVGTAHLDDPKGEMNLLDLKGKAENLVMTLNSL